MTRASTTKEPPAVIERLGRWVAALTWEDIPEATRAAARAQVLSTVAAAFAAARSEEARSILAGLERFAPSGRCTVVAHAEGRGPIDAAVANAALSMAQDYDDIVWMGHTCHSAVWASLAAAEHAGADARTFLTAVVAANEVGGRLGASALLGPLNGQMWTFIHLVGAAAATAKLLGLSAEETSHALAISLAQPTFALQPGFMTPTSKLLAASTPTATGMRAAYFASEGMTGAPSIVEDRRGFWSRFSYHPLREMLEDLSRFWVLQTLTFKTHPGCHYFQTTCTALGRVLAKAGPISPDDVRSVHVETTKLATEATRFASEYAEIAETITPVNVNFDLRVTAAIFLIAGRLTSAEVEPEWLRERSAEIHRLRERIRVSHAPELTLRTIERARAIPAGRAAVASIGPREAVSIARRYRADYRSELVPRAEALAWLRALAGAPRQRTDEARRAQGPVALVFPARVHVTLCDGRVLTEEVDLPVGSVASPTVLDALREKVLGEVAPTRGERGAAQLLERGLSLGEGGLTPFVEAVRGDGRS